MTALPDQTGPSLAEGPDGLPGWMRPPREEGWIAEDLDELPEAPRHTELIDGTLVFRMSPQRSWHSRTVSAFDNALARQAPGDLNVEREMTVVLDRYNRPEPDVVVSSVPFTEDRTRFEAADVVLVVEVVSAESAHRDRRVKPHKYAAAEIRHYWRVENEEDLPVVHAYELDETTRSYAPLGIFRGQLKLERPFPISLDLLRLVSSRGLA